jgi:hypothetical protein
MTQGSQFFGNNAASTQAELDALEAALPGTYVAKNGAAQRTPSMFDDFDRADGPITGDTSPSGDVWFVTGPGNVTAGLTAGKLTDTVNFYAVLGGSEEIKRVAGTFSFFTGAGTDRTIKTLTLAADHGNATITDVLHLNFGPDAWDLTKRVASGSFVSIATGTMTCRVDGTVYGIAMEIDTAAGTVTIIPPMGQRVTVTDADITTIAPLYGWVQYQGDATGGYKGRWHSVTRGPSTADALRAAGLGASTADLSAGLVAVRPTQITVPNLERALGTEARAYFGYFSGWALDSTGTEGVVGSVEARDFATFDWATFDMIVELVNATTDTGDIELQAYYGSIAVGGSCNTGTPGTAFPTTALGQYVRQEITVASGIAVPVSGRKLQLLCYRIGGTADDSPDTKPGAVVVTNMYLRKAS